MKNSPFRKSKAVLIFNGAQVLIGILRSLNAASEYSGGNLQSISYACAGTYISSGGYYYRYIHENIEVGLEDIDSLRLKEYDRLCGENDRKYRSVRDMAHKRKARHSKKK
ncbi:hypothetical protein DW228_06205 [Bacteroides fragilis]|uniref:Uncharacterized protein n=1 Tax=Bacteroides fragilis TaxID=817 RepID=A0A396C1E1_BACFG|nr:hypothetical protein [Bacteroides fragilis]RHH14389.1 hypothetical protein DW228_06205 [Bacteroides fragilis]